MEKLAANHENRTYFFTIVSKKSDELAINMYGTAYSLIKQDGAWRNKPGNKMNLVQGLVESVVATAFAE